MCCCDRKKRDACLSAASCASLPIAATQRQAPRRGDALRSPFFAYFLWRDKESERLPGRPRQRTPVRRKQTSSNNRTRYQQTAQPENQAWCATSQEYVCARHTRHTYRALSVHTRSARPPTDRKRYKVPQHKQANAPCNNTIASLALMLPLTATVRR